MRQMLLRRERREAPDVFHDSSRSLRTHEGKALRGNRHRTRPQRGDTTSARLQHTKVPEVEDFEFCFCLYLSGEEGERETTALARRR